ncbi:hypothetical protein FIV42_13950 [Persicimonas caeni]|uniref:Uncharacterized protein n=1 Tax=Persicimonas caeni TaxID=2292766 RepID=A0A4Y6PTZ1_PERCE|nr:hypothetical protein [Persicimonas caeni]QDG51804.1 hypothetical protein FIV42_13950 [Persicimonas caeni]QED33025.1 hypothetical protein FRD00_13945 [Persicimonas caeni]
MLGVKRSGVCLAFFLVCLGLISAGCGDNGNGDGGETVFLYVTNGYPGASSLTLYGPTGKLVSGLPFGKRTEEPIEVDRNVNSTAFTLVLDGAPTEMLLSKPLFSMYPQETGTLIVSRRSNEAAADATLYRHIRTPDPDCVTIFGNSLSLNNSLMPDQLLSYSYQTEWNVSPQPMYDESLEQYATTRCGFTPVPDNYKRPQVHTQIANDPWFFPVTGQNNTYTLVWGVRRTDPRTGEQRSEGLSVSGQIYAEPTTEDFMECLSSAVTIEQEDTGGGGGGGGQTAEQECPTPTGPAGPDGNPTYAESQVVWNVETLQTCFEPFTYSGYPVEPGQPDTFQAFSMSPVQNGQDLTCGSKVRVRTPVQDLIFQNVDDSIPGYIEGEGGFIEIDATYPASEQHFFVVFGRPVNAFVQQWNGEETSVDLGEYPYPGDLVPDYAASSN